MTSENKEETDLQDTSDYGKPELEESRDQSEEGRLELEESWEVTEEWQEETGDTLILSLIHI